MKATRLLRTVLIATLLASNVGCDQITKHIVRDRIHQYEQISLFNDYLTIMKVENTGAFLSLGQGLPQPIKIILLMVIPLGALIFGIIFLFGEKRLSTLMLLAICCVVGGGIGNIYDRIVFGSVTDFLHIDFGFVQTGIFNLADVSIMLGVIIAIFDAYMNRAKNIAVGGGGDMGE